MRKTKVMSEIVSLKRSLALGPPSLMRPLHGVHDLDCFEDGESMWQPSGIRRGGIVMRKEI